MRLLILVGIYKLTEILNFVNPHTDWIDDDVNANVIPDDNRVHIRIFKRNARKSVTTVENLPHGINLKNLIKALKKSMNCNGNIVKDEKTDLMVISLQGVNSSKISLSTKRLSMVK